MDNNQNTVPLWSKNLIIITIVNFFIFFGFEMLLPVLPRFAQVLGAKESTIGLVTGLFTISAILIRPISGTLLDRFGRRIILVIGTVIFLISVLSYSIISTIMILLLFRFIHGFGWGLVSTASNTIASDNIPEKRFGEGMGYFSLSSSLAMALGPMIGLFVINNYSFKLLFYISAILIIISFIISFNIKYNKLERKDREKTVLFGLTSIRPAMMIFFLTITYGTIVSFLPIYAEEKGIENIGIFFTIYAISMVFARPLFGRIIDKFGFDYSIIPGIILVLIGMIGLYFANSLSSFLLISLIYGVGFGSCQSSLQTMIVINTEPERRGAANATFFTGFDAGIAVGSIVYGFIASKLGYSSMYLLTIIPVFISFLIYIFVVRKTLVD